MSGPALWISEPAGMVMYRNDTRSVRNIILNDTVEQDTIRDIAENSSTLWVLARSGAYQIDLATTTVEKLPGNRNGVPQSRLAVDDDYVWLGLSDTLWRFDKLGREWFSYTIKSPDNPLCGMYSDGTNVYCVQSTSIKIFSAQEEKWREFPYPAGMAITPASQLFLDKNALVLVEGASIFRYIIDAQSWDVITAPSPVIDLLSQDTVIFYMTSGSAFQYFTKTSVTRPLDIPGIEGVRCFTRIADTLLCATRKNFIKYDFSARTSDNILAPQNIADFSVRKSIMFKDTIIALCPDAIAAYDTRSRLWESVPLPSFVKRTAAFVWNDGNGAKLDYAGGYYSQLRGTIQQDFIIDSATTAGTYYSLPVALVGLTLHNQFSKGNYCNFFFDNTDISKTAKKGVFYRGSPDERVETGRLGTVTLDIPQSNTILRPQYEGGNIILQSKSTLATRDRRIVKAQAGGGLLTTKTLYEVLPYSESGFYKIISYKSDTLSKRNIVPGSVKIMIDGETIDSMDYTFVALSGSFKFNRHDLLDPTSILTVSYQVMTVPDSGVAVIEVLPENNFGRVGFGSVTVSPKDWLSPQVGFLHLDSDSTHRHDLVNVSAPSEIRTGSSSLFLKFNPEITYDAATGAKAAGLSLQSRFGEKLSLRFNGLLPDSNFVSTDNLERGYGFLRHNADASLGFDIRKELPLSYYQHDIVSVHSVERRYEFKGGSHFQGLPFCDVSLSRNIVKTDIIDTLPVTRIVRDTVWDSIVPGRIDTIMTSTNVYDSIVSALDRNKDKFRVRLYETSSPILEKLLHINRFNYDMSYTGFSSRREGFAGTGYGSVFFGRGTMSPIKRLTFTMQGTYFKNAPGSEYASEYDPSFILQTIDAPAGFDIAARNELTFRSITDADSSFSSLRRNISITVKPGSWWSSLGWLQPLIGFNQTIYSGFTGYSPGVQALLIANDNVIRKSTTRSIGANFFLTNDITFRNDNLFTTADSTTKYYLFNDLKWWFTDKRFWQTRWEYDRDRPRFGLGRDREYNRGFSRFTNTWFPWLLTNTGFSSSITVSDSTDEIRFGPDATVSVNTQEAMFIRTFAMSHTINLSWVADHGIVKSSPEISYSLFFRAVILPNISIMANNSFTFENGGFVRYNGIVSASAVF